MATDGGVGGRGGEPTSGTEEAPSHADGRGEQAVPLGAAVVTADHEVLGQEQAAGGDAAVPRVVGDGAAHAANHAAWRERGREGERGRGRVREREGDK